MAEHSLIFHTGAMFFARIVFGEITSTSALTHNAAQEMQAFQGRKTGTFREFNTNLYSGKGMLISPLGN